MSSIEELVLENQLDAFTRVLSLFSNKGMKTNDVFNILSQAENDAQFVCGFIDLNKYDNEKKVILEHSVNRGLVTVDKSGHLQLTAAGKERAKKELPQPIEQSIRDRQ